VIEFLTALELNPLEVLSLDNCASYLNSIRVGWDPQGPRVPRLPDSVGKVYNLIALACSQPRLEKYL